MAMLKNKKAKIEKKLPNRLLTTVAQIIHVIPNVTLSRITKVIFWFSLGALLGFFFFASFLYIAYRQTHGDLVYEGVMVNGVDFGGKTKDEVRKYFREKNSIIQQTQITLTSPQATATISARQLNFGFDADLLAQQAFSIGRSDNTISNMSLLLQAYIDGIRLSPSYTYSDEKLKKIINPLKEKIEIKPVDALFNFENGKVVTFRFAKDGRNIDEEKLQNEVHQQLAASLLTNKPQILNITIPVVAVKPAITDDKANKLGIKELIAEGSSLFRGSIENRIFNLSLAASRINGTLVPPGATFSFNKTVGDISSLSGYRQAYVIQNGRTVLGDGGGVCQVSTTLFRAVLNAGLPLVERNQHAYRVGYYEQDYAPGVDAAIYTPNIDLKFKNDTKHHILVQSYADLSNQQLIFRLYGTKDNREVTITQPVILSQSPAPEPVYQDDPTLPKGQIKQVDFSAPGANVYFTRTVKKDGKTFTDKFSSNYKPWQAVFLRGTKE